ncbi:hypothetical protein BGX30_008816 [Mortierella sp. GBA39]|nr:hypothetical protein BGX30_008816 [Mortierella sp. GBA39]
MLVGSYVAKKLEQLGIGTAHSEQDYMTTVADYNYNFSYKYSRETSLSENSILIEVGGIDSTDAELKRTSEVLAQTIADVYYADQKAEKASTDQTAPAKKDHKS